MKVSGTPFSLSLRESRYLALLAHLVVTLWPSESTPPDCRLTSVKLDSALVGHIVRPKLRQSFRGLIILGGLSGPQSPTGSLVDRATTASPGDNDSCDVHFHYWLS